MSDDIILELNLPGPSNQLLSAIMRCASEAPLDTQLKKNHERLQSNTVNAVSRQFEKDDEEVIRLAREQYQPFFDEEFFPVIGILTNVDQYEKYACWPPHSDRERIFGLNWYIEEGGDNVSTVFYKQMWDHEVGAGTGKIWKYSEVELDQSIHFEINKWYALSVRRAHSIEKIETRRLLFSLSFYNMIFDDFKEKYKKYIVT